MGPFDLSDGELLAQCSIDPGIDPNCSCLLSGGGPEMNTDISGPGVRISFYLQAYFLSILSTRSASLKEISSALSTLMVTSMAMVVASFILAFKAKPTMSLQDAIVVLYLLCLAWASAITSMTAYNRFVKGQKWLLCISMIQFFWVFAFGFVVVATAPSFGSTPRCNTHAVAVIFKSFPVLNVGRFAALVVLSIVTFGYFVVCGYDYRKSLIRRYKKLRKWYSGRKQWVPKMKIKAKEIRKQINAKEMVAKARRACLIKLGGRDNQTFTGDMTARDIFGILPFASVNEDFGELRFQVNQKAGGRQRKEEKRKKHKMNKRRLGDRYKYLPKDFADRKYSATYNYGIFGTLLIELIIITTLWALFVMNTELLIVRNRFEGGSTFLGESFWEFGQVLPMLLVILPLVNVVDAFKAKGLSRRTHQMKLHSKNRKERKERRDEARRRKRDGKRKEQTEEVYEESQSSPFGRQPGLRRDFDGLFIPPQSPPPCRPSTLGAQGQAHISAHSFHSTTSTPGRRDVKRHLGHGSDSASDSSYSTSSDGSFSTTFTFHFRSQKQD